MKYPGSKRKETKGLYPYLDFSNINTIVEPYAGTCAISFYIAQKRPGLTYILNDKNPYLKEMYEMRYQYDRDYYFDSSKFNKHFNYTPTSNAEAVKQTVAELKKKASL